MKIPVALDYKLFRRPEAIVGEEIGPYRSEQTKDCIQRYLEHPKTGTFVCMSRVIIVQMETSRLPA